MGLEPLDPTHMILVSFSVSAGGSGCYHINIHWCHFTQATWSTEHTFSIDLGACDGELGNCCVDSSAHPLVSRQRHVHHLAHRHVCKPHDSRIAPQQKTLRTGFGSRRRSYLFPLQTSSRKGWEVPEPELGMPGLFAFLTRQPSSWQK